MLTQKHEIQIKKIDFVETLIFDIVNYQEKGLELYLGILILLA